MIKRYAPRIVLVDDDQDFRYILNTWLHERYTVMSLPDGEDLIEELADLEPDLIMLDVRMPGPDGFKLCRCIRNDVRFGAVPILFLTGCKSDDDFQAHMDVGGSAMLTKPVERRTLIRKIDELLRDCGVYDRHRVAKPVG